MKHKELITNSVIAIILVSLSVLTICFTPLAITASATPKPIYKGNGLDNNVSLMVNVYWGEEYLTEMLDTFDKYNVKTTFFVGGSWVAKNSAMLKEIYKRGHEIGNHGYLHKDQDKIDMDSNLREISLCHNIVEKTIGYKMTLFAPPSGAFSNDTLKAANNLDYTTIMWSKDTIDWRDKNAQLIYDRATKKVAFGDLILMHPTKCTAEALPKILEYYKTKNIKADKVSNVIKN
ncbi:MAG: polysaccharide deacetylase family protein [Clostridia bacterium]|nr:polysaccharide deacetylase family protein [Clostridia bacterium]